MEPINEPDAAAGNALAGPVGILGDIGGCINSLVSQ
jgi:hypothetical protein